MKEIVQNKEIVIFELIITNIYLDDNVKEKIFGKQITILD